MDIEVGKVYKYINANSNKSGYYFKVETIDAAGYPGLAYGQFVQKANVVFEGNHCYILTSYLNERDESETRLPILNEYHSDAELPPIIEQSICCDSPNIVKNHVMVMGEPLMFRVCRNCKEEIV